jgi:hypothetical protein
MAYHLTADVHDEYMRVGLLPTSPEECLDADNLRYYELVAMPVLKDIEWASQIGERGDRNSLPLSTCLRYYFRHYRHYPAYMPGDILHHDSEVLAEFLTLPKIGMRMHDLVEVIDVPYYLSYLMSRPLRWYGDLDDWCVSYPEDRATDVCLWGPSLVDVPMFADVPEVQAFKSNPVGFIKGQLGARNTDAIRFLLNPDLVSPERLLLHIDLVRADILRIVGASDRVRRFFSICQRLPRLVCQRICRLHQCHVHDMRRVISNTVYEPAYLREWYVFQVLN